MRFSLLLLSSICVSFEMSSCFADDLDQLWDAGIECPGGVIKFGLEMRTVEGSRQAFLINGAERIQVPSVKVTANEVLLDIDHYDSRLRLICNDGRLQGTWKKRRGIEKWLTMEVIAKPHEQVAKSESTTPFVGRWDVDFDSSDDGAVGVFAQQGNRVQGTFMTTTGDYRFLDGTVEGGKLRLSCFDGGHAFLFHATVEDDGTLAGNFWSSNTWHEKWSAKRNPDASLPDSFLQTTAPANADAESLMFPDLNGVVTSVNDARFQGKARIVYVFGSWCPNCHDAAAWFSTLQQRYESKGLSILGLAFELTGDFERDAEQVRTYAKRHHINYPILIAGLSDKKEASKKLPVLDKVRSYPTTIFMDRNNKIRAIHTGFSGPATGAAYEKLQAKFVTLIEELLGENAEVEN